MSEADPNVTADPLLGLPAAERVHYATGVLLDAEDFLDEQTYHRARLGAALKAVAGFGTLSGLRVRPPEVTDPELELSVDPGLALDRLGRLIEVKAPQCIRIARWFAAQPDAVLNAALQGGAAPAVTVDVFISARDCARAKSPAFATGPFDALDAVVPSRLAETPLLELVPRDEAAPIPVPKNFWPKANAPDDAKLTAVLGSHEVPSGAIGETFARLQEQLATQNEFALFLARVSIPVTVVPGARPALDPAKRASVDNSLRPFIFLPGKWLGTAFANEPLIQP